MASETETQLKEMKLDENAQTNGVVEEEEDGGDPMGCQH